MFTGLIESVGILRAIRKRATGARITVESDLTGLRLGESISVDGICQTIAEIEGERFSCDVLPETLRVSTLGSARVGARMNLERAVSSGERLGGHFVTGHVDGLGKVKRVIRSPRSIEIEIPQELIRYVAPKASIAVNGVSLTVGPEIRGERITVFIVPFTWEKTNLRYLEPGNYVNIEVDILARYMESLLRDSKGGDSE